MDIETIEPYDYTYITAPLLMASYCQSSSSEQLTVHASRSQDWEWHDSEGWVTIHERHAKDCTVFKSLATSA